MLEIIGSQGQITIDVTQVEEEIPHGHGVFRYMEWSVTVHAYGLSGKVDGIGIWPTHYEKFLLEFTDLERNRRGTASLTSMSPEELQLTFRNLDTLGHMMVEGQLGRYTYVSDWMRVQKLNFAFEIDPTTLPSILHQFSAFKMWESRGGSKTLPYERTKCQSCREPL